MSSSGAWVRGFFIALTDLVGATILTCFALLLGPLAVLRGPLVLESFFWYLWVLGPQGLLSKAARAGVDWRLGNFDASIVQFEYIVSQCEQYFLAAPRSSIRRLVLEDFYTILTRAYLHSGHIDDAMLVILRAKKATRLERLPGLPRLDAKTAHLVRAGLAAGRLLDGGGLATLFVKSSALEGDAKTPKKTDVPPPPVPPRQGASKSPDVPVPPPPPLTQLFTSSDPGAKILPFKKPTAKTASWAEIPPPEPVPPTPIPPEPVP